MECHTGFHRPWHKQSHHNLTTTATKTLYLKMVWCVREQQVRSSWATIKAHLEKEEDIPLPIIIINNKCFCIKLPKSKTKLNLKPKFCLLHSITLQMKRRILLTLLWDQRKRLDCAGVTISLTLSCNSQEIHVALPKGKLYSSRITCKVSGKKKIILCL